MPKIRLKIERQKNQKNYNQIKFITNEKNVCLLFGSSHHCDGRISEL